MNWLKKYLVLTIFVLNINVVTANSSPAELSEICGAQSCEIVFKKMKRFARNGSAHALAVMSLIYRGGHGTEVNEELSVKYMKRAARKGLAFAQYDVALAYSKGYFVEKDLDEANMWLKKAAIGGYEPAIELLISENKISAEERMEYEKHKKELVLEKGEELLVITADKYTLTDLAELLKMHGYGSNKQTGSRIRGKGCGNNASSCAVWRVNTPVGNTEFITLISKMNAFQTAQEVRGR